MISHAQNYKRVMDWFYNNSATQENKHPLICANGSESNMPELINK